MGGERMSAFTRNKQRLTNAAPPWCGAVQAGKARSYESASSQIQMSACVSCCDWTTSRFRWHLAEQARRKIGEEGCVTRHSYFPSC